MECSKLEKEDKKMEPLNYPIYYPTKPLNYPIYSPQSR